ncbi:hypothetical protein SO802_018450 [Lithocarpus litseifolius]|uniref:Uncharacterized protein n=1 Tax=Lithocarpus litseifolius TaxID=425828 RepID=A0AAW2CKV8_9ROSI
MAPKFSGKRWVRPMPLLKLATQEPLESLSKPPAEAIPGLPRANSSVLSLKKPVGGGPTHVNHSIFHRRISSWEDVKSIEAKGFNFFKDKLDHKRLLLHDKFFRADQMDHAPRGKE